MAQDYRKFKLASAAVGVVCLLALIANRPTARTTENSVPAANQVSEIAGYKGWTKVNPVPQLMPQRVAASCVLWQAGKGVVIDGPGNPHRDKSFTVYVNDVGRAAMLKQKSPKFPVGSVIVKEKLPAEDSLTPELLTVMIKQQKGFNPASGDWEYMVVDGTGTKMEGRGKLENCQGCHLGNQKSDYIFRTYLPDEAERNLK